MRIISKYAQYLIRLQDYYRVENLEAPEWIQIAQSYNDMLDYGWRHYWDMCSDSAIPKKEMEYLSNLVQVDPIDGVPKELMDLVIEQYGILIDMYTELMEHKNQYFLNEWTLTKAGRKKMREYVEKLPSSRGLNPPTIG